jgi:hypothetical protein
MKKLPSHPLLKDPTVNGADLPIPALAVRRMTAFYGRLMTERCCYRFALFRPETAGSPRGRDIISHTTKQ